MSRINNIVDIGAMDERIELHDVSESVDSYGAPLQTYSKDRDVWAQVLWTQRETEEEENAMRELPQNMVDFVIRYASDVDETWRIVYDGRNYDIESIEIMGRRQFLKLRGRWRQSI
jgi:SPP1 family predicted phage head-tail adaptor